MSSEGPVRRCRKATVTEAMPVMIATTMVGCIVLVNRRKSQYAITFTLQKVEKLRNHEKKGNVNDGLFLQNEDMNF